MGKFDGVLLASDYDDTLYGSALTVSKKNSQAIQYFIRQGGRFTVATGRAQRTFAPQLVRENIPMNAPAILSNGAVVYDFAAGQYLHTTQLPSRAVADLTQLCRDMPEMSFEAYCGEEIYVYHPNEVTRQHLARVGVSFHQCAIAEMPTPWIKVILEQDHPMLVEARDYVLRHWSADYEAIFSNRYLLEVTCKGSTKGGMVQWVAHYLGVQPQHIYCVGDNENDIPMLAVSAIPFAPANAAQAVKDYGARLVSSCDEDCIAEIIGILDARY